MPDNNKHLFIAYECGWLEPDRLGSTQRVVFKSIPHPGTRGYPGRLTLGQVARKCKKTYLKPLLTSLPLMLELAKASPLAKSKDNGVRKYWPTLTGGAARLYGGRSTD